MGKNLNKQDKNKMRDALTGKRIGNKEVIIVDNAIDWVKKQGYLVIPARNIMVVAYSIVFSLTLLLNYASMGVKII